MIYLFSPLDKQMRKLSFFRGLVDLCQTCFLKCHLFMFINAECAIVFGPTSASCLIKLESFQEDLILRFCPQIFSLHNLSGTSATSFPVKALQAFLILLEMLC